ncbi:lysine transporter LysE [Niveispirillum lacus]|uniref:Lysine transporter LysE n=1 Tax=Niveispirillum lacus TaxID=1981099 RepID=A0A255YZX4_9PROT|nr:LysE family translocator [Niveispirillum lacus]OYQ34766.1 lysine transporter LysE [Niveispirillum lacus]
MNGTLLLAMASFALVASITPGPVNSLALTSGVHYGFRRSLGFVTGATLGFTALLLLAGVGMAEAVARWPLLDTAMRVAGTAFLFHLAYRLWQARGGVQAGNRGAPPGLWAGASLQWLNPKAWIAAIAGMGAYGLRDGLVSVLVFAGLYFIICFASIALWAFLGERLSQVLGRRMPAFNRAMAGLLALGAVAMLAGY